MLALYVLKLLKKEAEKIFISNGTTFEKNVNAGRIALEDIAKSVMHAIGLEIRSLKENVNERVQAERAQSSQERLYTSAETEKWNANALATRKFYDEWQDWAVKKGDHPRPQALDGISEWIRDQENDLYQGTLPIEKFDHLCKERLLTYNEHAVPQKYIDREWMVMAQQAKEAIQNSSGTAYRHELDNLLDSGAMKPSKWQPEAVLNDWQDAQCFAYRKGALSKEKVNTLKAIGFNFDINAPRPTKISATHLNALKDRSMAAGQLAMAEHGIEDDSPAYAEVEHQMG